MVSRKIWTNCYCELISTRYLYGPTDITSEKQRKENIGNINKMIKLVPLLSRGENTGFVVRLRISLNLQG
jgi:hypothetical protein